MKVRTAVLTAVMAVAMVGQAADYNWGVNPGASWGGYVNAFELDGTTFATGFGEATATGRGDFTGSTLNLRPSTRLYDEVILDPFWVDQGTLEANKVIEFNMYQESLATIGETLEFNWEGVSSDLGSGYEVVAFVKVLDAFASWATTQYEFAPVVPGQTGSLSLTVADAGAGDEFIQAGFAIKGIAVSGGANALAIPADPASLTSIQIIPEPATIGLMGIAGLGMFVARRRLKI